MASIRLSHKAQEEAALIGAKIEGTIRGMASKLAENQGKECADAGDVREAYRLYLLNVCKELLRERD